MDGGRSSILQNVWTWEHCVDVVLIDYFIEIMLLGSLCFILRISFKEARWKEAKCWWNLYLHKYERQHSDRCQATRQKNESPNLTGTYEWVQK